MRSQQEHNEQAAFFRWCGYLETQHPALGRFFAVPNGGARHKAVAANLKAEGVKRGVPDVFNLTRSEWPESNGDFWSGLILEFKSDTGRLSPEQRDWCEYLREQGYRVEVPRSWVDAALIAIEYFGLPVALKTNLPLHRVHRRQGDDAR